MGDAGGARYGKRYEVLRYEGAEGPVKTYAARDVALDREVVLKVFKRDVLKHEARRSRLAEEVRRLSRVESPNVVPVYDFGVRGEAAFAVMARVEGLPLVEWVVGRALDVRVVAGLGAQLAAGLAAAHEVGVLHRDVTPKRVLVTPDGTVKLTSFGLALYMGEQAGPGLTGSGYLMGTAGYVPPEIYAGAPSSPASDVFAAAATLYRALTGRLPVPVEALALHGTDGAAPAVPSLSASVPGADAELDRIFQAALELDPARRTRTAEEFRAPLLAWSQGSPSAVASRSVACPPVCVTPSTSRPAAGQSVPGPAADASGDEAWARRAALWLVVLSIVVPVATVSYRELGRPSGEGRVAPAPVASVPAGATSTPPLMVAVAEGDVATLRSILDRGADPSAPDVNGETALHLAVRRADDFLFRELLARGADPLRANRRGETPLDVAAKSRQVRLIVDAAVKGFGLKAPRP